MNSPSILSNMSKQTMNSTASHNIERINALADKLTQIQVNNLTNKFKKIFVFSKCQITNDSINLVQFNLRNEKMTKIEKLDDLLKTTGEQLIDYSDESNAKFSAIKDQVN